MSRTQHPLSHFDDYDAQDVEDLKYGGQFEHCERFAKAPTPEYEDSTISRDWSPEED